MAADAAPIAPPELATPAGPPDERRDRARARADVYLSGLGGIPLVLPGDEARAIDERTQQWNSSLRPGNAFDMWIAERISYHSLRLEDCEHRDIALRLTQARRAELCWDADRRRAAGTLAASLPKDPARVAGLLAETRQGADWLLDRWDALVAILDAGGDWTDVQKTLALDLLGVPAEFRDGRTPLDPAPGADAPARLRALAAAESRRLRDHRAAALVELDDRDRALARLGKGPETPELAAVRRDHRFHARELKTYRSMLNGGLRPLRSAGRPWTPPPANPIPAPVPESASRFHADPPPRDAFPSAAPEPDAMPAPPADFAAVMAAARGLIEVNPDRPAARFVTGTAPGHAPIPGDRLSGPTPNRHDRRAAAKVRRGNPGLQPVRR